MRPLETLWWRDMVEAGAHTALALDEFARFSGGAIHRTAWHGFGEAMQQLLELGVGEDSLSTLELLREGVARQLPRFQVIVRDVTASLSGVEALGRIYASYLVDVNPVFTDGSNLCLLVGAESDVDSDVDDDEAVLARLKAAVEAAGLKAVRLTVQEVTSLGPRHVREVTALLGNPDVFPDRQSLQDACMEQAQCSVSAILPNYNPFEALRTVRESLLRQEVAHATSIAKESSTYSCYGADAWRAAFEGVYRNLDAGKVADALELLDPQRIALLAAAEESRKQSERGAALAMWACNLE